MGDKMAYLVQVGSIVTCNHGGTGALIPSQTKAIIAGVPICTIKDLPAIVGCKNSKPCTKVVSWAGFADKTVIDGVPVLLSSSIATTDGPGTGTITGFQAKVSAY